MAWLKCRNLIGLVLNSFTDHGTYSCGLWLHTNSKDNGQKENVMVGWCYPFCDQPGSFYITGKGLCPSRNGPGHENAQNQFWEEKSSFVSSGLCKNQENIYKGLSNATFADCKFGETESHWIQCSVSKLPYNWKYDSQRFCKVRMLAV